MTEKIVVTVDKDLEDLIPLFLKIRQDDLRGLATGLASSDFEALRVIGHSMKGAGSSFGFQPVTRIGDQIEAAAIAGDQTTLSTLVDQLRDYLARVTVLYA